MRSHLLEGKVRHRRARPFAYELEHDVCYFALDLAELDEVDRPAAPGQPQPARTSSTFRDADHLPAPATDLAADIRAHLRREGIDPDGWRMTLVTNLRVLGYVFNPASFFLCRDAAGILRVVVVEVHNTFGERHLYTLRRRARAGRPRSWPRWTRSSTSRRSSRWTAATRVHVRDEPTGLRIAIDERQDGAAAAEHQPRPAARPR